MKGWKKSDLETVIDIARSQLGAQRSSLDRMLTRAQLLFTTLLALLALLFGAGPSVWVSTIPLCGELIPRGLYLLSAALLTIALLGTAALIAVRKEFEDISASVLSQWDQFDLERLALEYTQCLGLGEDTNNAHLSSFGTSVRMTLYGAIALGLAVAIGAVF